MANKPKKIGPRDAQVGPAPQPKAYSEGAWNILITAEKLFGKHGLDGVSMRQILLAAGHGNKAGVYHHFGSKDGLIQAVFDMRMSAINEGRRQRLLAAERNGRLGVKELLEALLLPFASIPQAKSRHACCQFHLQLLQLNHELPIHQWHQSMVSSAEIDRRLREKLVHLSDDVFLARYRLVVALFLTGMAWPNRRTSRAGLGAVYESDLISMAAAAFEAPLPVTSEAEPAETPRSKSRPTARRPTASTPVARPK